VRLLPLPLCLSAAAAASYCANCCALVHEACAGGWLFSLALLPSLHFPCSSQETREEDEQDFDTSLELSLDQQQSAELGELSLTVNSIRGSINHRPLAFLSLSVCACAGRRSLLLAER
jgi:hypothetical protein